MGEAVAQQNAGTKTRVMLVEDSAVVRGMVRKWLEVLPGIEVTESAENGKAAIERAAASKPDIVILDIEMPVMDGLTALPSILRQVPNAKVLIASTLSRRNAEVTLRAMSLGATDCIVKPSFVRDGNDARAAFQSELVMKVQGLADAMAGAQPAASRREDGWAPMPSQNAKFIMRKPSLISPRVLVIGSSTGGPSALSKVFEAGKSTFGRVPVLVTQHMPPTFTALLGEKLAKIAGLEGGEAKQGQLVEPGHLYVAPGGKHMRVRKDGTKVVIALDDGPAINHCRPAVDPLFESISDVFGNAALGAVLTGMGSDGALGAVKIADKGGTIIAQDAASSVVWGMPGAVAAAGAASALIGIDEMGSRLAAMLAKGNMK